jgi:hypothetical protein
VRQLVLEYYVVLDSILRDKAEVRHLLAWCRHCGIPFLRDPHNAGREDLGCPFGCADLHRRRRSNERSADYNRSPLGKLKRHRREEARKLAAERLAAADAPQAGEAHSATTVEAAHGTVSRSVEVPSGDRPVDPGPSQPEVPPPTDPAIRTREAVRCYRDSACPSPRDRGPDASAAFTSAPERHQIGPGILAYIQFVISLLEGRSVHRVEILEMLARTKRQHSFARERRVDYVLRRLREEPEKPP